MLSEKGVGWNKKRLEELSSLLSMNYENQNSLTRNAEATIFLCRFCVNLDNGNVTLLFCMIMKLTTDQSERSTEVLLSKKRNQHISIYLPPSCPDVNCRLIPQKKSKVKVQFLIFIWEDFFI